MDVAFIIGSNLPETYRPGGIYFIKNEGAIYVATSETELVQYSGQKTTEELIETKQDTIEDLESIREQAALGATAIQEVPTVDSSDIDKLFEL